jgi:hypothetical protein
MNRLCLIAAFVALLSLGGAQAQFVTLGNQGVVAGGAPPVGPPVFTFTDIEGSSTSGNTATVTLAIGTASSNRRVYVLAMDSSAGVSPQAATGASFNGGTIAADVFQVIGTTPTDQLDAYLISAVIPTGTTVTVTLTYASTIFSSPHLGAYTVDTTTLGNINPVTSAQSVSTAGLTNPATANTFGIPVATSGSAILSGFVGFGINNGSQSFTSSDAGIANDGMFASTMVGHANNVPVSASSRVNTGWTGTGDSLLALVVLR